LPLDSFNDRSNHLASFLLAAFSKATKQQGLS
jgi:hypothetical protein